MKIDALKKIHSQMNHIIKSDLVFYFDECENIRSCRLSKANDTIRNLFFCLGGVATNLNLNKNEIIKFCGLQNNTNEIYYKLFVKRGSFLESINSNKLLKFFLFLKSKNVLMHIDIVNFFYYAITDILDSFSLSEAECVIYTNYHQYQDDMYSILTKDSAILDELFFNYKFPNIPSKLYSNFINDIYDLYEYNFDTYYNRYNLNNFSKELLRQIIKSQTKVKDNELITSGKDLTVINNFYTIYLNRMIEIDAIKVFDIEKKILEKIKSEKISLSRLKTKFIDSKKSIGVQCSDVICGFVSHFYEFINQYDDDLAKLISSLTKTQKKVFQCFFDLFNKSASYSNKLIVRYVPISLAWKVDNFLELLWK